MFVGVIPVKSQQSGGALMPAAKKAALIPSSLLTVEGLHRRFGTVFKVPKRTVT